MARYERVCGWCGVDYVAKQRGTRTCRKPGCRRAWIRAKRSKRMERCYGIEFGDLWRTNPDDWAYIVREFGPGLDAAALPDDALCDVFIGPPEDSLTLPWTPYVRKVAGFHKCAFANPPYLQAGGGVLAWVKKAVLECRLGNIVVVLLVPPSMNTAYMQLAFDEATEIRIWRGRRQFLHPDTGEPEGNGRGDSCLLVFRPEGAGPARFSYIDDGSSGE